MALPSDLVLAQHERPYFEWANGTRHEKVSPNFEHGLVQAKISSLLLVWGEEFGAVATEVDTNVTPSPGDTRRYLPDIGFTSFAALEAAGQSIKEIPEIAPDLAVEVLSVRENRAYLADKVNAYLAGGSIVVIVADPLTRSLAVHRRAEMQLLFGGDIFSDPAFPGLTLHVNEVFRVLDRRAK